MPFFKIYRILYFSFLGVYFLTSLILWIPKIKKLYRLYYKVPDGARIYLRELLEPKFRASVKAALLKNRNLIFASLFLLLLLGILVFFV